jgi:DNA-binding NtrC family response regulator
MESNHTIKCTVVICHREEIKTTLFEILKRMNCEVCEVSTLDDLLNYIQSSDFTFYEFTEIPQEDSYHILHANHKTPLRDSPTINKGMSKKSSVHEHTTTHPAKLRKYNHITLGEIEKLHIINTLEACNWKIKTAAKLLGIDRTTLYRKIKKYGIPRE